MRQQKFDNCSIYSILVENKSVNIINIRKLMIYIVTENSLIILQQLNFFLLILKI